MHYTMENLISGRPVEEYYARALQHWREVLVDVSATDVDAIASKAQMEQFWFEQNCGGRCPGQEVMVWAGICQYYTTADGFGSNFDKAQAMYQALLGSRCSVEIHSHARDVAKQYDELLLC